MNGAVPAAPYISAGQKLITQRRPPCNGGLVQEVLAVINRKINPW